MILAANLFNAQYEGAKMNTNKIISIVVGCMVLLVIGIGYFYYASGNGETATPSVEPPAVVANENTNSDQHTVMKPTTPPDGSETADPAP